MLSSSSWREALRAACIITTVLDYEGVMLASERTRAVDTETNVNEFSKRILFLLPFSNANASKACFLQDNFENLDFLCLLSVLQNIFKPSRRTWVVEAKSFAKSISSDRLHHRGHFLPIEVLLIACRQ